MAQFEGYERREAKILAALKEYGISSIDECKEICDAKGINPYKIVEETQPIAFENAKWAYTVGAAIAIKSGQSLTDATSEIQTALTSAFREHLGVEKLGRIDVRVTGFKGLIYKPTTKFLPPTPEIISDDDDVLLSDEPTIDSVDSSPRNNASKE